MCKEFVTDYEFVKVNDHKSHILMNCTNLEKLSAVMEDPFIKEWDKKNNCDDYFYSIELVELMKSLKYSSKITFLTYLSFLVSKMYIFRFLIK